MLTVNLGLDFAGTGVYFVHVGVQSDVPPASQEVESMLPVSGLAIESAGDKGKEVRLSGDSSPSGAIDTKNSKVDQEVEAGGREMVPGETQDLQMTKLRVGRREASACLMGY